jgi:hypothetical protein
MRATRGDPRGAVRILGAASPVHDLLSVMFNLPASEAEIVAAARRTLGEVEFAVAWAEGQSITLEQATAEILSEDSK